MADETPPGIPEQSADNLAQPSPADAGTASQPEIPRHMIDVHPPHEAVHSWKAFLIHIATIVIGLLIAITLEQSVEWLHHRHQLRDARRNLAMEIEDNRRVLKLNLEDAGKVQAALIRNQMLLRNHASLPSTIPADLDYSWKFHRAPDAAWLAAKQDGSLSLMPYGELKTIEFIYTVFGNVMDASTSFANSIEVALAISKRPPDGSLSLRDIEELVTATSDAQGKLNFTIFLLGVEKNRLDSLPGFGGAQAE
jgi:hypothetical protein